VNEQLKRRKSYASSFNGVELQKKKTRDVQREIILKYLSRYDPANVNAAELLSEEQAARLVDIANERQTSVKQQGN
jgi:hypothetical protein